MNRQDGRPLLLPGADISVGKTDKEEVLKNVQYIRGFPGSPVVETAHPLGAQVQSLVGELSSHLLCDVVKQTKPMLCISWYLMPEVN